MKESRLGLVGNPYPRIPDAAFEVHAGGFLRNQAERDRYVAGLSKFNGIADEVEQNLAEPDRIAHDGIRNLLGDKAGQFEMFPVGCFCH